METLFELWSKRDVFWEKRYQEKVIDVFCDYGRRYNSFNEVKGKIFGPGYEIFIIAFFIGLYYDRTKPLIEDVNKIKKFGQPIMYWGTGESRLGRKSYSNLKRYIFAALIARTDIDFIAIDKGDVKIKSAVDALIDKMEQYANFGFDYIEDKLENDPNYYFKDIAFLQEFTSLLKDKEDGETEDDDMPEPLD